MVFVENNVRPQCYRCNIRLSGNTPVFEQRLRIEVGVAEVDAMFERRSQIFKKDRFWYADRTADYTARNQKLKESAWQQ